MSANSLTNGAAPSRPKPRPSDTISAAIESATQGGRPALVGFLTGGFPNRAAFKHNLELVAAACDVVEIGVPFTDPMADGAA